MTRTQLDALAAAVVSRRRALGLKQADLSSKGGPGVVTVGKIERAEINSPLATTLQGLDRALRWREGSAAGILQGQPPQEIDADEEPVNVVAAIIADDRLLPEAKEHLVRQYGLLLRVQALDAATSGKLDRAALDAQAAADVAKAAQLRTTPRKRQGRPLH